MVLFQSVGSVHSAFTREQVDEDFALDIALWLHVAKKSCVLETYWFLPT